MHNSWDSPIILLGYVEDLSTISQFVQKERLLMSLAKKKVPWGHFNDLDFASLFLFKRN